MSKGWIGVDLDGTWAYYTSWKGETHIGDDIPAMTARIKKWLAEGVDVRVFTARVSRGGGQTERDVKAITSAIQDWTFEKVGVRLPVTCEKDYAMVELWDDRAIQVVPNRGVSLAEEHEAVVSALQLPQIPKDAHDIFSQNCTRGPHDDGPCNGLPTDGCPILVGGKHGFFAENRHDRGYAKRPDIDAMVQRFLGYKLPENFHPDGGVSFKKFGNEGTPHQYTNEPTGTNLLDAEQARQMIQFILGL